MLCRRAAAPGASSKRGGVDTDTRISPAGQGQGQGHAPRAGQAAAAPRCRRKSDQRVRGAERGRSAPLPREPKRCQVPPGGRGTPLSASLGLPTSIPPPAPSRRAVLGSSLCPAPVELPWPILSRCGARRAPEAGPLLPPGQPGSVSASLRSARIFPKFLPDTVPSSPEAGSRGRCTSCSAPCSSPAPSASLWLPLSAQRDGGRAADAVPSLMFPVVFQG